jgi:dipeptidyl aminopeptidase/acylaminoacyl peptidase
MPSANLSSVEFSRDETKMVFYANTSRTPPDLYVYAFDGQPPRRLTNARNPEIDERDLVEARSVRFLSFDGLEIPGLLYLPKTASPDNRVPAVVWVHGGPGGQSRVEYKPLIQYLVNQGYAVFAVNNRGSSGYGKSFFRADDRRHGKADLDDLVASKQALVQTGLVSPQRIGIIGTSYGGFLVLAAMSFRPDEFAAGVELFGIANWIRTLEVMPPWWQYIRGALYHEIGDPQQDRDYLKGISPLFHANKIVKPLMVLQGRNDPRVVKSESDAIVRAARANGAHVEYLVFDDEGHGLRKKENKGTAFRAIHRFLDGHVKHLKIRVLDGSDVVQ